MTTRRRFFPTAKVQHVPGQTVELEMQLRPLPKGVDSVASGVGEVFGIGWLAPTLIDYGMSLPVFHLSDGRYEITGVDGVGLESSIWEGVPQEVDGDGVVRPLPGPNFHCTELQVDTTYWQEWPGMTFFGVIQGASLVNASWEFEWDFPSEADPAISRRGHLAVAYGNILQIRTTPTDGSMDEIDTLTARAFSGGSQVGQLIFRGHAHGF